MRYTGRFIVAGAFAVMVATIAIASVSSNAYAHDSAVAHEHVDSANPAWISQAGDGMTLPKAKAKDSANANAEAEGDPVLEKRLRRAAGEGGGLGAPKGQNQAATSGTVAPHYDSIQSNSKWMALVFWLFALVTVGGSIFVLTRRNLIAAVMGMVGTFFGIAAAYMLLYASFLAAIQILVYAGAIMVLFVFVVMILNRPEEEPRTQAVGTFGKAIAGLGMLYLAVRLVGTLWSVSPPKEEVALRAPAPVSVYARDKQGRTTQVQHEWGSTRGVGTKLFTGYLFPFEAVSILLLLAVVGAITIARPHENEGSEGAA